MPLEKTLTACKQLRVRIEKKVPATAWDMLVLLTQPTPERADMTEPEELQAQIDGLRLLVMSLLARVPAEEISKDVEIRFESWEDMHIPSGVSDSYLDLMQTEKSRALHMLQTLRGQQSAHTATSPLRPPSADASSS